jgi:hypothetical protein
LPCRYTIADVIIESAKVSAEELQTRTGWELKPEGLCKGDRCVPLADGERPTANGEREELDVRAVAERLRMPLVHDEAHGLHALGPESGGRALSSAQLPAITLPDRDGNPFSLQSLLGSKVLLVAWASW